MLWIGIGAWGLWAMLGAAIDAIPDLSDNQVIVFTDWQGRSPQEVEDQITYPLTTNLQGLPGVKVVRSSSAFGFSMIFVIFNDDVDLYFARTRVLERLNLVTKQLPDGSGRLTSFRLNADAANGRQPGPTPNSWQHMSQQRRLASLEVNRRA
jgi:copper/silver efflux system protein